MNHTTLTYPTMTEAFCDVTFHKTWSPVTTVSGLGFTTVETLADGHQLTRALRKRGDRFAWVVVAEQPTLFGGAK